jgi:hypothetical protein
MENTFTSSTHPTKTGISVQHKDNLVETYNKNGKLIHLIDCKEASNKIAIHRWLGSVSDDEVKEIFDVHLFEFIKTGGYTKLMADTSKMDGFFDGVNQWLADYYIPRLLKVGVKYNAFLVSEEFFSYLTDEGFDGVVESLFTTQMFGSEDKAIHWLKSVNS